MGRRGRAPRLLMLCRLPFGCASVVRDTGLIRHFPRLSVAQRAGSV